MAWSLRFGAALLLALAVGCNVAPAASPAQQQPFVAQVATPELAATTPPTTVAAGPTESALTIAAAPTREAPPPEATPALAAQAPQASAPFVARAAGSEQPALAQPATAQVDSAPPGSAAPFAGQPERPAAVDTQPAAQNGACDDTARPDPLPSPGSPRSQDFFRAFRTPLAPAPLYDPPGQRRVGLQAGHWLTDQVPLELGRLQGGAVGGGKQEWEVNLDIAQRAAALLEAASIQVDVLPATVPPSYRANAFIALHADGDPAGVANGFKVTRPGFSSLPAVDDRLVETFNQVYSADTELPRDDEHISLRMRYYYAFNSRRYCHAVAPGVPQAIIEMGYLTSPLDRRLLIGDPDRLARGIADSVQAFLSTLP